MDTLDAPTLPPVFQPQTVADGDPIDAAIHLAAAGGEPGTLLWTPRRDRLDMAVVLGPDRPLAEARRVVAVALVALADALEALGPPNLDIAFAPSGSVLVNGASVGGVTFAAAPDTAEEGVPAWAVLGARIDVLGDPEDPDPGLHPDLTALREEGFGDVEATDLLESYARHLLSWIDTWDCDGFEPVHRAWRRHALEGRAP